MSIEEFAVVVKNMLEEKTGKEVEVSLKERNNGVILHGVCVLEPESNMAPVVYLEPLLAEYEQNNRMEDIIEHIMMMISNNQRSGFDMEWFCNFENVKDKVAFKVVNYVANTNLLNRIPYEKVLDLAKVYYVVFDKETDITGTILIHNTHLEMWGITEEYLKKVADGNTERLFPAEINNMGDVIKQLMKDDFCISEEMEQFFTDSRMYVAYNKTKVFGAAVMFYPHLLREFAEKVKSNIVILPSSVHEIIIFMPEGIEDVRRLKSMVYEVNKEHVPVEEILSDSVYWYDLEKQELSIV